MNNSTLKKLTLTGLLVTMGIVFGDIGTSPLYVMKAITGVNPSYDDSYIIGAVSCVIWTLTLQTTVKYVWIALKADNRGEGGILALYSLLRKSPHKWLYIIAGIGASTLVADGVITPAITVTSAIEGLRIEVPSVPVIPIVVVIITLIFLMQQWGTGKIGRCFGPFMLVWFLMLGILGACSLPEHTGILRAFNPWYAVRLLVHYPGWFLILGAVFLCTTGAEALYSDLGHCGRRNISVSWIFVKVMLILNYLGQGAWLIAHKGNVAGDVNPFYAIMPDWMLIPGVIMSAGAAIIASQALLSGSFTIFSEAINLDFWPKLKIKYPSVEKGQLYIPAVNWALYAGCLLTVAVFRNSSHMEAAYGLAITVTMIMTTVLITMWLRLRKVNWIWCGLFLGCFGLLEGVFFVANLAKFTHGGWFSLLIAAVCAFVMLVWRNAIKVRSRFIDYRRLDDSAGIISSIKQDDSIPKYASNLVYLSKAENTGEVESKIVYSIINKQPKRADHYWFIHLELTDEPDTLEYSAEVIVPETLYAVNMRIGYRVDPKVSVYFRQVVEDLQADGKLDLRSGYPSLHERGIPGDFRFVMLHRVFSRSSHCSGRDAMLMKWHQRLRRLGISDASAFGLDTSSLTEEVVPLIINTSPERRIARVSPS